MLRSFSAFLLIFSLCFYIHKRHSSLVYPLFNSLSRLPLKTRHSRRVFFTRRSSPDTMIKKIATTYCCRNFFGRGDGTCSARFPPPYSLPLYAFIFIKGILLLFILCFNSLSRRGGKQPFRRLFGRIALFHFFSYVCNATSHPFKSRLYDKKILHRLMQMQDFWSR